MKISKFRLMTLAVIIVYSVSLLTVMAFASSNGEVTASMETGISAGNTVSNDSAAVNMTSPPDRKLIPILSQQKFAGNEPIVVSFDNTDIVSYHYIADGITVTEDNESSMQFALTPTEEFGSFNVYAECENGDLAKGSLYTYKYGDTVYISDVAKDQAWYDCMEEQYEAELITLEEWQDAYSILSQNFAARDETQANAVNTAISIAASDISPTATSSDMTISGTLRWEINTEGHKLPLRMTKVELHDKDAIGSRCIATGYTDANGYYSFTFENSDDWDLFENGEMDFFIRVILESETFKVAPDWLITCYHIDINITDDLRNGSTTGLGHYVRYDESQLANKATYVQQGMVVGQRFAKAMGMTTSNFVHVAYPSEMDMLIDNGLCWGVDGGVCISIIGAESYKNIDMLIHEYGHFVEVSMGNFHSSVVDYLSNGPEHNIGSDHFADKEDKAFAMYLAWSESWATAFSLIAQDFYKTEYIGIAGFADIECGDTDYTYEAPAVSASSGEAQELAVTAVLWDLYDTELANSEIDGNVYEAFDKVSLGSEAWWECTTRTGTFTLTDFVDILEECYPDRRGDIGRIMAQYHISPGELTVTNLESVSVSTPPELSWKDNGSMNKPNDRFQVVFYNSSGDCIYSSPYMPPVNNHLKEETYAVPQSVWDEVTGNYSDTFTINIAVKGYCTGTPVSGPYISQYVPVTVTFPHKHVYQYAYTNTSSHTGTCTCGDTITEAHWVRQSELVDTYGVCSQCGAIIDLRGGIIGVNPFSVAKVSVNGSYLLPNCIAVIADEDVEAYLNGTLIFYGPDDLPVTQ